MSEEELATLLAELDASKADFKLATAALGRAAAECSRLGKDHPEAQATLRTATERAKAAQRRYRRAVLAFNEYFHR
jgi:multidrug resistance efflux pump